MTLKHWLKIPHFTWLKLRLKRFLLNSKNLKTVEQLHQKEAELKEEYFILKRKNTDESNLFADYNLQKLEIIKWILGEYGI